MLQKLQKYCLHLVISIIYAMFYSIASTGRGYIQKKQSPVELYTKWVHARKELPF